ncbi:hypothetical protein [Nostoc sp. DSM 114167]|uniref:hypothetical protein n=1 Tax=Nostoc sp. DSM 114167 TaxID=3439050 RepID=UPI00404561E9
MKLTDWDWHKQVREQEDTGIFSFFASLLLVSVSIMAIAVIKESPAIYSESCL